jgi:hypothetical protein
MWMLTNKVDSAKHYKRMELRQFVENIKTMLITAVFFNRAITGHGPILVLHRMLERAHPHLFFGMTDMNYRAAGIFFISVGTGIVWTALSKQSSKEPPEEKSVP